MVDVASMMTSQQMAMWIVGSTCCCGLLYRASQILSPMIVGEEKWSKLKPEVQRNAWHCTLLPMLTPFPIMAVLLPAFSSVQRTASSADWTCLAVQQATAIATGYFVFDSIISLWQWKDISAAYGASTIKLMVFVHHLPSILTWPMAALSGHGAFFVFWFLLSESTNVLMNLRWLLLRVKVSPKLVEVVWGLQFLLTRILPIPYLLYSMATHRLDGWSMAEKAMMYTLVPIPSLLNAYWFTMIYRAATKVRPPMKTE